MRTTKHSTKNKCRRTGAAAVEFAIVLPIFLILIFGIVEFGRAMMAMQVITNAAREGARACAVSPLSNAEVQEICQNYADACGIRSAQVQVTPDPAVAIRGEPIAVRVSVEFSEIAFLTPFFLKDSELASVSTMRKEREFNN